MKDINNMSDIEIMANNKMHLDYMTHYLVRRENNMKMSAGEASILGKLEQLEHNQKKIMEALRIIGEEQYDHTWMLVNQKWMELDQELKDLKKLKAVAKKNGYSLAQWKKKLEIDK